MQSKLYPTSFFLYMSYAKLSRIEYERAAECGALNPQTLLIFRILL